MDNFIAALEVEGKKKNEYCEPLTTACELLQEHH
jgi:hypothetical protein